MSCQWPTCYNKILLGKGVRQTAKLTFKVIANDAVPQATYDILLVRAVVWECGEGQTDRQTDGRDQYTYSASATRDARCTDVSYRRARSCRHSAPVRRGWRVLVEMRG